MLFSKLLKFRSSIAMSLLACLGFVCLAVFGWDVSLASIGEFLLISTVLVLLIMLAALALVALYVGIKRLLSGKKEGQ